MVAGRGDSMMQFITGLIIGGTVGVFAIALVSANRD